MNLFRGNYPIEGERPIRKAGRALERQSRAYYRRQGGKPGLPRGTLRKLSEWLCSGEGISPMEKCLGCIFNSDKEDNRFFTTIKREPISHISLWDPGRAWMSERGRENNGVSNTESAGLEGPPRTLPLPCQDHRAVVPALGGLWEASWVEGPAIDDSSVKKMFLVVRASEVGQGLAP